MTKCEVGMISTKEINERLAMVYLGYAGTFQQMNHSSYFLIGLVGLFYLMNCPWFAKVTLRIARKHISSLDWAKVVVHLESNSFQA
ncbi:hypothetical protein J3998_05945 [Thiomicrorhabdus sp. 6S2-11]|uniref:Uncharacterized protein n=1 Tax=Thiomicrorhabdus marina TaxID=2818442 RepID=A0ABS3Q4T8_9GAMM|nr:hypothetical protein [Thiomicrorhabdus marina]MBO1927113.1 hypothetical protein [Thiomicrorhabdus marina]